MTVELILFCTDHVRKSLIFLVYLSFYNKINNHLREIEEKYKAKPFFFLFQRASPHQKITSRSQYFIFPQVIVYQLYYDLATRINT